MTKIRKDGKGRVLHKRETYVKKKGLYSYSYMDSLGNRRYLYSKDLLKLREKEAELEHDKNDRLGCYAIAKADINYAFDRYMAMKTDLRSSTRTNYIFTYNRYVRKGFGKKRLSEVRYSEVLAYYKGLIERGLGVSTVDNIHTLLHPTFQMAVRDDVIRNNPSDGALSEVKKQQNKNKKKRSALTIEQQRAFLDYVDKPEYARWKPLFVVMFGTGVRVGEVIGLRWSDLDFKGGFVDINHSITYYPRGDDGYRSSYEVSLPKTKAGIRKIPMLDEVRAALDLEKQNQKQYGYHSVASIDGMSGFIFCNRFGNLLNQETINSKIKDIVSDYNAREEVNAKREHRDPLLIPRFSCHVTRHTFCTRLCENETNIKVIQTTMGHKDIKTTLDIYAEVSEQKKKEAFDGLNRNSIF